MFGTRARVLAAAMVAVLLLVSSSVWVAAQGVPQSAITLISSPPNPVSSMGAALTGYTGTGPTLYYWVVARYPGGLSLPQGPAVIVNTPGAANLSATRFVTISWATARGATGYDVIRGTSAAFPASPSCAACAVVLNVAALSAVDNNAAPLGAYPPAGIPSAQSQTVTFQADSTDYPSTVVTVGFPGSSRFLPTLLSIPASGWFPVFGPNGTFTAVSTLPAGCPLCELLANKNAASGYAGLTVATKLNAAQGTEVWAIADLSDITGIVGNTTTVQMAGAGAPNLNDCAQFDANGNIVTAGVACGTAAAINLTGTYAALPAAGTAGRMYFPTDSPYTHLRDNGVSWNHFRHGVQVTPPNDALFAWVNQETATVTTTSGAVVLLAPANAGQDDRLRVVAAPARPFTVTIGMIVQQIPNSFPGAGLVLRDSVGGDYVELMFWENAAVPTLCAASWTDFNNFAGCLAEVNTTNSRFNNVEVWVRAVVEAGVGGNRIWSVSYDGVNYLTLGAVQWDTFIGALDQIGFETQPQNATFPASITVFHWLVQ